MRWDGKGEGIFNCGWFAMKVSILCSDINHPIYRELQSWVEGVDVYDVTLADKSENVASGDILFLVSCTELIEKNVKDRFKHTLVLHASDLPEGRGWSPHIWDVLQGREFITLSLVEAEDKVDTGRIWKKKIIELDGTELYDEINNLLFIEEINFIEWACDNYENIKPVPQGGEPTYYRKRTPIDSQLNVDDSIKSQFNLLRICDPERYPAFFEYKGKKYKIKIERIKE